MTKPIDLMFGCFGNGVTVCDRSRTERGDYKTIAHIAEHGGLKLYDHALPPEALHSIEACAREEAVKFQDQFIKEAGADARSYGRVLGKVYDSMTCAQLLAHTQRADKRRLTPEQLYELYINLRNEYDGRYMA